MWKHSRSWPLFLSLSSNYFYCVRSFQTTAKPCLHYRQRIVSFMASNPPLIDVDCNLWHKDLKPLLVADEDDDVASLPPEFRILKQDAIQKANIVAMLAPSSTLEESTKGVSLLLDTFGKLSANDKDTDDEYTDSLPVLRTTVGVHPYHVNDEGSLSLAEQMEECARLLSQQQKQQHNIANVIAAVGECGLDASEGFPPLEDQIPFFRAQIELAERFQLPLFVHERLAFDKTMEMLAEATVPVLIHCFTGNTKECKAYLERGFYISVSGYICKENSESTLEALAKSDIPLDRLMLETDAPYMGFPGSRDMYLSHNEQAVVALNAKKRKRLTSSFYPNLPSSLPLVLDRVLAAMNEERKESLGRDELARATSRTANAFFGFGIAELD